MKKKISITIDEAIYHKLIDIWKEEQQNILKSQNPLPVSLSEIAEKLLAEKLLSPQERAILTIRKKGTG